MGIEAEMGVWRRSFGSKKFHECWQRWQTANVTIVVNETRTGRGREAHQPRSRNRSVFGSGV